MGVIGRNLDDASLEHHLLGRHVHHPDDLPDLGDDPRAGYDDEPVAAPIHLDLGRQICRQHPGSDTLYIPCPHFATAGVIEPLEREFDITVITALQAIVWRALRKCGQGI